MENYKIKMVGLFILALTLSGCCKWICKPDVKTEIVEVKIPVYSCPAPKSVPVRPALPEVVFISPLDQNSVMGIDETNYKNNTILYMNLQTYVKELEGIVKFYIDNDKKSKEIK
jgi:hypothetical protein